MTAMVAITTQRMTISPTSRSIVSSTADDHTRVFSPSETPIEESLGASANTVLQNNLCVWAYDRVGSLDNGSPGPIPSLGKCSPHQAFCSGIQLAGK